MKQFGKILKFEIQNYFANKVFVGVTAFLMVAIAIVMFFPRISGAFSGEETPSGSGGTILLAGEQAALAHDAFAAAFPNYNVRLAEGELDSIRNMVVSGEADCAFVLDSLTSYTYYVNDLSMYDQNTYIVDELLQSIYRMNAMIQGGMSPEDAGAIMNMQITHETTSLGKDQMQNFFYTYIMIFALYMVILLYGQMVATNVATEKSSRAMELLITSAAPSSMMFGKVIASCLAGLIQLIAVFGSALLFYNINQDYWGDNEIVNSIFNMPLDLFAYMLVFFVLGFLIYAFMYGAVGSTASKLEDINTSVMPITFLFIIAFFVVMFSMASGEVDTVLIKVCSFIPFTSPMAMFTRLAMSNVPPYEVFISIAILIGSVFGIGMISAKIYRIGVLLYGTPPKPGAIFKAIRQA